MFAEFFVVNEPTTEEEVVRAYCEHVIRECGGHMTKAAKMLGIDRRSLYRRIRASKY